MKSLTTLVLVVGTAGLLGACERDRDTGDRKLELSQPDAVTIERGGTAVLDVDLERENVAGDATITFNGLPSGVTVLEPSGRIMGDHGSFTLRASETADLVEDLPCTITATAGGLQVSQQFELTVEPMDETVGAR